MAEGSRVIHITSIARSGSTMLGALLGAAPGAVHVGELSRFPADWARDGRRCSCGQRAAACVFWGSVLERLRWDAATIREIVDATEHVERHAAVPRRAVGGVDEAGRTWRRAHRALLDAVGHVSGAHVIVDSSKRPGRALALWRAWPLRVQLVHLERGSGALIYAWTTPNGTGEQPIKRAREVVATIGWVGTAAAAVARGAGAVPVRYETLARDPGPTLRALGPPLRLRLDPVADAVDAGLAIPIGHVLSGNRMRREGPFVVRPPEPPPPDSRVGRWAAMALDRYRQLWAR